MRNLLFLLLGLGSPVLWAQSTGSIQVGPVSLDSIEAVYVKVELVSNPYGEGYLVMILYGAECEKQTKAGITKEDWIKFLMGCSGLREGGGEMLAVSGVADLANLMHRLGWAYVELVHRRQSDFIEMLNQDPSMPSRSFYLFRRRDL